MGAAEARLFAREGAKVVIGDVLDDEGRQTEAAINEFGGECLYVHLDVTSEERWGSAVGGHPGQQRRRRIQSSTGRP